MDNKRKSQKRQSRKRLLEKRKDSTFIAEYVRVRSPDIYAEAENFVKHLKAKYPRKRDHTKTVEFTASCLSATTATSKTAAHCTSTTATATSTTATATSTSATATSTSATATSTSATATSDNMMLSIPLLSETVVAENITPLEPFSQEIYESLMEEMSLDPQLEAIFHETINGLSPLEIELVNT